MKRNLGCFSGYTGMIANPERCSAPLRQAESAQLHWQLAFFIPYRYPAGWTWTCPRCITYDEAIYILTLVPCKVCKPYLVEQLSWELVCIQAWGLRGLIFVQEAELCLKATCMLMKAGEKKPDWRVHVDLDDKYDPKLLSGVHTLQLSLSEDPGSLLVHLSMKHFVSSED